MAAYGVRPEGNWEGKNVLELTGTLAQREALAEARGRLWEARERRVRPGRDDKVLTSWNGLMLAAFSAGGRILERADYLQIAEANAGFLLDELRGRDGRLWHAWKDGRARFNGYLEDYAYLIDGLLELYQATFAPRWYLAAQELAEVMLARFADPEGGLLFDTSDDHEPLVVRPRDLQDNATPSGNAMAATALLKLAGLSHDLGALAAAQEALAAMQPLMARVPLGFGQWLQALTYTLSNPREIAIIGDPDAADTQALLDVVRQGYRPFQAVALGAPGAQPPGVPLLQDRGLVDGRAAAYVCRDFACQAPVTEPERLRALVEETASRF